MVLFYQTWFDDRLKWNPDEYNGIKEITLNIDKIWVYYIKLFINIFT